MGAESDEGFFFMASLSVSTVLAGSMSRVTGSSKYPMRLIVE